MRRSWGPLAADISNVRARRKMCGVSTLASAYSRVALEAFRSRHLNHRTVNVLDIKGTGMRGADPHWFVSASPDEGTEQD